LEKIPRGVSGGSGGKPPQAPSTRLVLPVKTPTSQDMELPESKIGEDSPEERLNTFWTFFEDLEKDIGRRLPMEEVEKKAKDAGLSDYHLKQIIEKLKQKGDLAEAMGYNRSWSKADTMEELIDRGGGMVAESLHGVVKKWKKRNPDTDVRW